MLHFGDIRETPPPIMRLPGMAQSGGHTGHKVPLGMQVTCGCRL